MDLKKWRNEIEHFRRSKDTFFASNHHSPIPEEVRKDWKGLNYFVPDPAYRLEMELKEHEDKIKIEMKTSTGETRDYLGWGEFHFKINDVECVLQAYKGEEKDSGLFVPFRDVTSGKETYGAGRYLELYEEHYMTDDGKWVVDFNMAYNPYCAYAPNYSCPVTPPENWLKVPIKAGEKVYSQHE